jgi:photosystem II stability/assembly factor-like uncharacterized protein
MKLSPLIACALALTACNDDPGPGTSGDGDGDGGGAWLVGERGTMIRWTPEGEVSQYPLDEDGDLRAIACKGATQAVAVGDGGVVLVTDDGGESWDRSVVGDVALRAVALSAGPVGYIVGDGVALRTVDDNRTWEHLELPAADWRAVATTAAGTTALLAAGGEIWRVQDGAGARVHAGDAAVAGLALTPDGGEAVAVGEDGLLLRSRDRGVLWTAEPLPTARDLHAVRIAGDASLVIAVGEAGAVVRVGDDLAVAEHLDPALSLRALHLSHSGHGHAVGDHGVMLSTADLGRTWTPVDLGLDADLLGLDDLHGEPHL